jgi:hypothetical protein
MLKKIGQKLNNTSKVTKGQAKIYCYELDIEKFTTMNAIVQRRIDAANEQFAQQMAEQEEDGNNVERFLRADDVNLLSLQERFGRGAGVLNSCRLRTAWLRQFGISFNVG